MHEGTTMSRKTRAISLSRRRFIVGSAAVAGGGLALGIPVSFGASPAVPAGAI
jgi:hypothetical protein